MTLSRSALAASALGLACNYVAPLDPEAPPVLNVISGDVVIAGDVPPGDVVMLLWDANGPPRPPESLGSPVTFATIPAEAFTGASADMQAASYAFTQIPDGEYYVTGVLDADEDFFPLVDGAAGGTCGDWAGYHVADFSTLEEGSVRVAGGQLVDNVTVVLAQEYTVERPAFEFVEAGGPTVSLEGLQLDFDLRSVGVDSELLELGGPEEATAECVTGFLTIAESSDGLTPDPHWVYGAIDIASLPPEDQPLAQALVSQAYAVWPRVFAVYTGVGDTALAPGEQWVTEAIHDADALAAGWPLNTPFPQAGLTMTFIPAGQHVLPDGTEELVVDPEQIPRGAWAIVVVQVSGQTWTMPNALANFATTSDDYDITRQTETLTFE